MITYKFKLYRTKKTKHIDDMLREACFVWNHALALQKRYYKIYGKYIQLYTMEAHFTRLIKLSFINTNTRNEVLERLDAAYRRFFHRVCKRPPKFKSADNFHTICFKTKKNGYVLGVKLKGNAVRVSKKWWYKFSLSRPIEGQMKRVSIKRTKLGEYFVRFYTDANAKKYGKTHKGASVGIDFGLKKYLTLSDGTTIDSPHFLQENVLKVGRLTRKVRNSKKGGNNQKRKIVELERLHEKIANKRNDYQWNLAHELCRKYDRIFIEDLVLTDMFGKWGRKMADCAHAEFVKKLEYVATKYDVSVHKIERFYPSSRTCTCGYVNKQLTLRNRKWTCPECGAHHDRDLLAANNILRRGIYELESDYKTSKRPAARLSCQHPTIAPKA